MLYLVFNICNMLVDFMFLFLCFLILMFLNNLGIIYLNGIVLIK